MGRSHCEGCDEAPRRLSHRRRATGNRDVQHAVVGGAETSSAAEAWDYLNGDPTALGEGLAQQFQQRGCPTRAADAEHVSGSRRENPHWHDRGESDPDSQEAVSHVYNP